MPQAAPSLVRGEPQVDIETNALRGWKEIAAHLKASERSVMRWEMTRGLPIHRVAGSGRDAVFARREELDAWLSSPPEEAGRAPETAGQTDARAAVATAHAGSGLPVSNGLSWVLVGATATAVLAAFWLTMNGWPSRQGEGAGVESELAESSKSIVATGAEPGQPVTLEVSLAERHPIRLGIAMGGCGWIDLVSAERLEICARLIQNRVAADVRLMSGSGVSPADPQSTGRRTYRLIPASASASWNRWRSTLSGCSTVRRRLRRRKTSAEDRRTRLASRDYRSRSIAATTMGHT